VTSALAAKQLPGSLLWKKFMFFINIIRVKGSTITLGMFDVNGTILSTSGLAVKELLSVDKATFSYLW